MKRKLTFLLTTALIAFSTLMAQDTTTTWINTLDEVRDQETAPFYRLGWMEDGKWQIVDHFRFGPLHQTGQYVDATCTIKSGTFITYNQFGEKTSEVHYLAGKFVGDFTTWYENGKLNTKGQYSSVVAEPDTIQKEKIVSDDYWNPQEAAEIVPSEEHGVKIGRWEYYHHNGQLSAVEEYDSEGDFYKAEFWNEDGTPDPIQHIEEQPAQFPGGEAALMKFLGENIKYPVEDRNAGRSGEVLISFLIDRNGQVADARIERSVSPTMDLECIRLLSIMPEWMPGRSHNRIEEVRHFLPIRFTNVSQKGLREMKKKLEGAK